jgi:hypothetical protein
VVDGTGELDVGVGEQDVRGDDVEVGDAGRANRQRLALDDRGVDALLVNSRAIMNRSFAAIAYSDFAAKVYR